MATINWNDDGRPGTLGPDVEIPAAHRNGHRTPATIGLLAGALMMVLDAAPG